MQKLGWGTAHKQMLSHLCNAVVQVLILLVVRLGQQQLLNLRAARSTLLSPCQERTPAEQQSGSKSNVPAGVVLCTLTGWPATPPGSGLLATPCCERKRKVLSAGAGAAVKQSLQSLFVLEHSQVHLRFDV